MSHHQINFIGWILFIVSAMEFIIASVGSFWAMPRVFVFFERDDDLWFSGAAHA